MSNWRLIAITLLLAGCQSAPEQQCEPGQSEEECKAAAESDWSEEAAREAERSFDQRGPGPLQ